MEPLLEIKGLDCGLLTNVNLHLDASEVVCLSGASGSGKTRLLRATADLDPNRGHLRIAGEAHESMPAHDWRRRVGYLPSESQWWRDFMGEHFARREVMARRNARLAPREWNHWYN